MPTHSLIIPPTPRTLVALVCDTVSTVVNQIRDSGNRERQRDMDGAQEEKKRVGGGGEGGRV